MKRYLKISVVLVTIWALASFVGVMFDTARAGFWTQSLMGALLIGALLAPLMAFFRPTRPEMSAGLLQDDPERDKMYEGGLNSPENRLAQRFQESGDRPDFAGGRTSSDSFSEKWPFVDDEQNETVQERA